MPHALLPKLKTRMQRLFTRSNWNLILELTRANFQLTDHNTTLGVLWSLLVPLSLFLVMYFAFRERFGAHVKAYPLYLLTGICCVNFFITSSTYMIKIFAYNRGFVSNSNMPRENLVISNSFIHIYKFLIEVLLCCLVSFLYNSFTLYNFLLLLPLLISFLGFVIGVGLILSLIHCFTPDIHHVWMITSRFLLFATPIFYTLESLSSTCKNLIYFLNPLTVFLISFRQVLIDMHRLNVLNYSYSLLLGSAFFVIGYYYFIILEAVAMERA